MATWEKLFDFLLEKMPTNGLLSTVSLMLLPYFVCDSHELITAFIFLKWFCWKFILFFLFACFQLWISLIRWICYMVPLPSSAHLITVLLWPLAPSMLPLSLSSLFSMYFFTQKEKLNLDYSILLEVHPANSLTSSNRIYCLPLHLLFRSCF